MRPGIATAALLILTALLPATATASTTIDIRGTWHGFTVANNDVSLITSENLCTGAVSGTGSVGPTSWPYSGTINGNELVLTAGPYAGGYTATFDGIVTPGGSAFAGTWSDSNGSGGNFSAVRDSGPPSTPPDGQECAGGPNPPPTTTGIATKTQVICTYRYATEDDLCTATVAAYAQKVPTGRVRFADARGGTFSAGNECRLVPTPQARNVASCAVVYLRPYEVPPARTFPEVDASYLGEGDFRPSSGSTQLLGCFVDSPIAPHGSARDPLARLSGAPVVFVPGPGNAGTGGGDPPPGQAPPLITPGERQILKKVSNCTSSVPSLVLAAGPAVSGRILTPVSTLATMAGEFFSNAVRWTEVQMNPIDQVDRQWRKVVRLGKVPVPQFARGRVKVVRLDKVPGPRFARARGTGALERAVDAYLANEAGLLSLERAQYVSIHRAQTAHAAGNKKWARRQMLAVAKFTARLATLRKRHRTYAKKLASALRKSHKDVRLNADAARRGQKQLRRGFPRALDKALRRAFGAKATKLLHKQVLRVDPASANTTLSALILKISEQDAAVSKILRRMAGRIKKDPSNIPGV